MIRRKLSKALVGVLVGAMAFSVIGCGSSEGKDNPKDEVANNGDAATDKEEDKNEEAPSEENNYNFKFEKEKFKGEKVTIWRWWGPGETEQKWMDTFTAETGCEVEYINVPWGDYVSKIAITLASGDGPDIIESLDNTRISFIRKGLVQPWDGYFDFNWVNLNESVSDFYRIEDKVYGIRTSLGDPNLYVYNKALFEQAGLEDPFELYKKGEWNWDNFREACIALTLDTNNDGVADQFAFSGGPETMFANGGEKIKFDAQGNPIFNMDDPAIIAAIEFSKEIGKYAAPDVADVHPSERFLNGEIGMWSCGAWDLTWMHEELGDNFGVIPYPVGPNAPADRKGVTVGNGGAKQLAITSKNPDAAAHWLHWTFIDRGRTPESQQAIEFKWGDAERWEAAKVWCTKEAYLDPSIGFGKLAEYANEIWSADSPAQKAQEVKAAAQAELDAVWADRTKPVEE